MPNLPNRRTLSLLERAMRENGGRLPLTVWGEACSICSLVSDCEHREKIGKPAYVAGGTEARVARGLRAHPPRWANKAPRGSGRRQEICRNAAIARHQRAQWAARDAQEVAT